MLDAAEHALQLEGFTRDQVLELRLRRPPLTEAVTLNGFLEQVSGPTPTPGGGTVAAVVGAIATSLATMVANLTIGKKKYADREETLRMVKAEAEASRVTLFELARRDSEAFDAVLAARRLPQATADEIADRQIRVAAAELLATRVPLETARACLRVVELAGEAARSGNPNAASDAGVAGLLAEAAASGALLNVEINLKSLSPSADKEDVKQHARQLRDALAAAGESCRNAVHAAINA
jgi:glutamate formiminotransferase/formiminotetrahydrofolate cyclodeaminase